MLSTVYNREGGRVSNFCVSAVAQGYDLYRKVG